MIRNTDIFLGPHVLVAQGFTSVAFAEFNVSFRHALRGIKGPASDRHLLLFLAAYVGLLRPLFAPFPHATSSVPFIVAALLAVAALTLIFAAHKRMIEQ